MGICKQGTCGHVRLSTITARACCSHVGPVTFCTTSLCAKPHLGRPGIQVTHSQGCARLWDSLGGWAISLIHQSSGIGSDSMYMTDTDS